MSLTHVAQYMAQFGRKGDNRLLHVSEEEIAMLESLYGGPLPRNPVTGLPEAFFFLPFLFGAAAPAAAGAAGAAATAAAPALAGLAGAAGTAGALGTGIMEGVAAGMGALGAGGVGGLTGAATTAASALPAMASAAPTAITAATTGLADAATALPGLAATAPTLPAATTTGLGVTEGITPALTITSATEPTAAAAMQGLSGIAGNMNVPMGTAGWFEAPAAAAQPASGGFFDSVTGGLQELFGFKPAGAAEAGFVDPVAAKVSVTPVGEVSIAPGENILSGIGTGQDAMLAPATAPGPIGNVPPNVMSGQGGAALQAPAPQTAEGLPSLGSPTETVSGAAGMEPAAVGAEEAGGGFLAGLNLDMNSMLPMLGIASMMNFGGGKKGGGDDDGESEDVSGIKYEGGEPVFPEDGGESGGLTDEWDYFPNETYNYAEGGVVPTSTSTMTFPGPVGRVNFTNFGGGGGQTIQPAPRTPTSLSGLGATNMFSAFSRTPQAPRRYLPTGPINAQTVGEANRQYAAKLSAFRQQQQLSQLMAAQRAQRGFAQGGKVGRDEAIVQGAVDALTGKSKDPDAAIMAFVKAFGEDALKDLVQRVQAMSAGGGKLTGAGDGMSDSIPAMIDGQQPAALSQGEFVVPADVVSGLGNGSTDAGAAQLEAMGERVRMARGGQVRQPPAMNPRAAMPI